MPVLFDLFNNILMPLYIIHISNVGNLFQITTFFFVLQANGSNFSIWSCHFYSHRDFIIEAQTQELTLPFVFLYTYFIYFICFRLFYIFTLSKHQNVSKQNETNKKRSHSYYKQELGHCYYRWWSYWSGYRRGRCFTGLQNHTHRKIRFCQGHFQQKHQAGTRGGTLSGKRRCQTGLFCFARTRIDLQKCPSCFICSEFCDPFLQLVWQDEISHRSKSLRLASRQTPYR